MAFVTPPEFTTRPTLEGHFGMTASTHWLGTATGQSVLERGGNAFDAAVACAFVLHVVEPHLNGPAGDMTGLFATAEDPGTPVVMMGQGPAPAAATIDHYRSEGLDLIPGAGALAAAVPGAVDSWLNLFEHHGSWELADVLEYAIDYASNGHTALSRVAGAIETVAELFTEHWPSSARLWMRDGKAPAAGDVIINEEYAEVLRGLIAAGDDLTASNTSVTRAGRVRAARQEWKTGRVALTIADFVRTAHRHSTGTDHAGVITADDLAGFSATFEDAATIDFRGYTIAKTKAWGQGPVLLQALSILDGFDDDRLDPSTEIGAHTILEALKLAMADRDTHYGDFDVDLDAFLSADYAAERRALIGDEASHEHRPGNPGGSQSAFRAPLRQPEADYDKQVAQGIGEPTVQKNGESKGDTCHIDVVDRWGNMISAMPSGGWLQSSPAIPGLGFSLGTRLQMNWLHDDAPSRLEPGKRPRTTLSPTLIFKDGHPYAALGSPGGDQQDQWQLLLVLRLLVGGYRAQEAIDAPAMHTTSLAGSFWPRTFVPGGAVVEDRLGEDVISSLEARGHVITRAGDWAVGRLSCVIRDPESGRLEAGANPRGAQGYAAGR